MSEMVERVAKAIYEAEYADPRRPRPDVEPPWGGYVNAARAAIEAMRKPTDAMLDAAIAPYRNGNTAQFDDAMRSAIRGYCHAMIDAALANPA